MNRLLQPIEQLLQAPDIVLVRVYTELEAGRLAHVDLLGKRTVQERVADVDRVEDEVVHGGEGEDGADGGPLRRRGERLGVFEAGALREALRDAARLVPLDRPISIALHLEHPPAANGALARRELDHLERAVVHQRLHLVECGLDPLRFVRAKQRFSKRLGLALLRVRRDCSGEGEVEGLFY